MSYGFEVQKGGEFAAGPGSDDGTLVGTQSTSKVGFYGTDPIAIQTLAGSTATVADVVAALAALGLVVNSG